MIGKNASRVLALLAFASLGLTSCNGGSGDNSSSTDPQSTANAVFSTLNSTYSTLATTGLLRGETFTLSTELPLYPDIEVSYSIDAEKETFSNAVTTFTLGAQSLLSVTGDTLAASAEGDYDEANPYGALTATITIDSQTFTRDYLVMVTQPEAYTIAELIENAKKGDLVTVTGIYTGRCAVETTSSGQYESAYFADGEYGMQLYRIDADMLDGLVEGESVIQVSGTYSPYDGLNEIKDVTSLEVITDDSISEPVTIQMTAENPTALTVNDINRRVYVEGGVVTAMSEDSYGNQTISWTLNGEKMPNIYVDSRYSSTDIFGDVQSGYTFSGDFFVSYDKSNIELEYPQSNVEVVAPQVTEVTINLEKPSQTIYFGQNIGNTGTVEANVQLPSGITDSSLTWKSSDESIATVSADGVVTAVSAGKVTITATSVADTTKSASIEVEIVAAPEAKTIDALKAEFIESHPTLDGKDGDLITYSGKLNYVSGKYAFVEDADGDGLYVYGGSNFNDAKAGDMVTVIGTPTFDEEFGLQITGAVYGKDDTLTDIAVSPKAVTSAKDFLAGAYTDNGNYVEVTGVTAIDTSSGKLSLTLSDGTIGTNTYSNNDIAKNIPALEEGQTYTVEGYVTSYSGLQIGYVTSITVA